MDDDVIAEIRKSFGGEECVFDFGFLQAEKIRLMSLYPCGYMREARAKAVDVPGGDFYDCRHAPF